MKITRELAIQILRHCHEHKNFYFPFIVMNKEYTEEDDDFVEIEPDEWEMIESDEKYQTFELWENLQNLDEKTLRLMSKGFIDKITNRSLENHIIELVINHRNKWTGELEECKKTEEYEWNEFIKGKAEAYEDCLEIIKMHTK